VHSLWVTLWKQKKFHHKYASDLRKLRFERVEEIFFCQTFIHSLQARAVDCGPNSRPNRGRISLDRDQFHSEGAELTPRWAGCMRVAEYAVDNGDLA
jgi:hypothetical protein